MWHTTPQGDSLAKAFRTRFAAVRVITSQHIRMNDVTQPIFVRSLANFLWEHVNISLGFIPVCGVLYPISVCSCGLPLVEQTSRV